MALTHKTTFVAQGLSRLISQFRGKPFIESVLRAGLRQIQDFEDELAAYREAVLFENAEGIFLTRIGKKVGALRTTDDDDLYKVHIRAEIKINRSNGKASEMIEIANLLLTGDNPGFSYLEYAPATIEISMHAPTSISIPWVFALLNRVRGAGVKFFVTYPPEGESRFFTFGDPIGGTAEDENLGWS